jgi:hypothetical protein
MTAVVVVYGNNNAKSAAESNAYSALEVYQREIGSKLTIVNRLVYNT